MRDTEDSSQLATQMPRGGRPVDRRMFMRGIGLAGALAGMDVLLNACSTQEEQPVQRFEAILPTPTPRLRTAFSHNGLNTIWNQLGRDAAVRLSKLLGIDIVSYDAELNIDKQRRDLEAIATQEWDFVVIHPLAVNVYVEQVRQIIKRGIPVIDIDTRLTDDLDGLGVTTFLEPDNIWMAEQVTMAIIEAVHSDSFDIVHTQGLLTHTGAQGRAQGFRNVIARYPGIKVIDETPADWDVDKVTRHWDRLLERFPNIRAGFFHNDEMALAGLRSIVKAGKQQQIVVGGIDGMPPACEAVARGDMVATVLNPTGRIHGGALWVGYLLATEGQQDRVPKFIRMDGGVITKENAAGYGWLGGHFLI